MRVSGFLPAQIVVSLISAERLSAHWSPYPPPCGRPLPEGQGLTIREWRQAASMQDRCAGRNYPLPIGRGGRGDREIHEQAAGHTVWD